MESINADEIAKHCTKDDAWLIIDGKVYDVTEFAKTHPGGDAILKNVGGNGSLGFHQQQAHLMVQTMIHEQLEKMCIGKVEEI